MNHLVSPELLFLNSAPEKMEAIQIGQLILSPYETKVIKRITSALDQSEIRICEFLELSPAKLALLYGVGATYLDQVPDIQRKLPLIGMRHCAAQWQVRARSLSINEIGLPQEIGKGLEKLKRQMGRGGADSVLAATILEINFWALENESGWGKASIDALRHLNMGIQQQLGGTLEWETQIDVGSLFKDSSAFTTADEIDAHLSNTISSILAEIGEARDREIIEVRLGIGRPKETLDQLGSRLNTLGAETDHSITRERVRQIEKRYIDLLMRAFFVSPKEAIAAGRPFSTSKLALSFPKTSALFIDNDAFLDFLALWSGQKIDELRQLEPEVLLEHLYPYFCDQPDPSSEEQLISALRENSDESAHSCRSKISSLEGAELLKAEGEKLWSPSLLPIEIAIPHVFAGHPEGLHWRQAMELIQDKGLLGANFPLLRAFQARVQAHPRLYLCGKGKYRHRRHHQLPDEAGTSWIRFIKSRLGAEAVNFRYWFHNKAKLHGVLDYYELRDLLNRLGRQEGVYFWGQSRRETVALTPDAPSTPNEAVLIELIENADRPLNRAEIEKDLFFIPESTIALQLLELVQKGKIKKIGPTHWGPSFRS